MQYINPYELLNFSISNVENITAEKIRKAKTALFREIDLNRNEKNDIGFIEYRQMHLTKADCIKPLDELDDKNKKDFHLFIYQNKTLNDFLTDGDVNLFNNFKVESIYKLPQFIKFISPFFAYQYNKKLAECFREGNRSKVSKILSVNPLVDNDFIDRCYTDVHLHLRNLLTEIKILQERVEENCDIANSLSFSIDPELINLLPTFQFQNLNNSLGGSIKNLAVAINNIGTEKSEEEKLKWFKISFYLIGLAKGIDCTGIDELRIRDNYFILKDNFDKVSERVQIQNEKSTGINPLTFSNIQRPSSNIQEFKTQGERNKNLVLEYQSYQSKNSTIDDQNKKKPSFLPLIFIALIVILVLYNIFSSNDSTGSSNTDTKYAEASNNSYHEPALSSDSTSTSTQASNKDYVATPVYVKREMMTGNFPQCSGVYPKFDYNLKTRLIVTAQSTDIALKLINQKTDRCIRFVFLNEGTTYTVNHIPQGLYYLKIAYGNDWAVKDGDPICRGHFTSNVSYKKDMDVYNFYRKTYEDGRTSTPYYTLKLYTIYTKDYSNTENSISEDEFNN